MCPPSRPSIFPLPFIVPVAVLSTGSAGGGSVPTSGVSMLHCRTTTICRPLVLQTSSVLLQWVQPWFSLCRTLLPTNAGLTWEQDSCSPLAVVYDSEELAAHVSLRLGLGRSPPPRDMSSSICGRWVLPPDYHVSASVLGLVHLTVFLFISRDADVAWDHVNLSYDAMAGEYLQSAIGLPHKLVPRELLHLCCLLNCGLHVAKDCHNLHSMPFQCFSLLNRLIEPHLQSPTPSASKSSICPVLSKLWSDVH